MREGCDASSWGFLGLGCLVFFNLRLFIKEEKLCLKRLIAIPPMIANVKHKDELLMVSNCPNCVVSKIAIDTAISLLSESFVSCSSVSGCDSRVLQQVHHLPWYI